MDLTGKEQVDLFWLAQDTSKMQVRGNLVIAFVPDEGDDAVKELLAKMEQLGFAVLKQQ
jgi:hypothetical protein